MRMVEATLVLARTDKRGRRDAGRGQPAKKMPSAFLYGQVV
jgi:hypothetical protein